MGASESKLVFKQGIFRLSEEQAIPANDPYWTGVSWKRMTGPSHADVASFGNCQSPLKMFSVCSRPVTYDEHETRP